MNRYELLFACLIDICVMVQITQFLYNIEAKIFQRYDTI